MRAAQTPNDNEKYFEWWLNDLYTMGIVIDYDFEPKTFQLQELLPFYVEQVFKTKDSITTTKTLFDNLMYTPDYKVIFDGKLYNKLFGVFDVLTRLMEPDPNLLVGNVYQNTIFYTTSQVGRREDGNYELWFDVKPPVITSKTASGRDFKYNKRLLFNRYGIYVNKIVPVANNNSLFYKTFFPDRYLMNDSNEAPRRKRISGKGSPLQEINKFDYYKSLQQYLDSKLVSV